MQIDHPEGMVWMHKKSVSNTRQCGRK